MFHTCFENGMMPRSMIGQVPEFQY